MLWSARPRHRMVTPVSSSYYVVPRRPAAIEDRDAAPRALVSPWRWGARRPKVMRARVGLSMDGYSAGASGRGGDDVDDRLLGRGRVCRDDPWGLEGFLGCERPDAATFETTPEGAGACLPTFNAPAKYVYVSRVEWTARIGSAERGPALCGPAVPTVYRCFSTPTYV